MTNVFKRTALRAARTFGTPLYVYDADTLEARCRTLKASFPDARIHYAVKANSNPALLSIIKNEGIGIETVSPGELKLAKASGFARAHTSFTCANIAPGELGYAARNAGIVHIDSLIQLETWGKQKLGKNVSIRVNQGIGSGHHHHTITGGPESKFGIVPADFPHVRKITHRYGLVVTGLHQHIGSGILSVGVFIEGVQALLDASQAFPTVTHLDFGGGFGIPYRPGEQAWDMRKLAKRFHATRKYFEKKHGRTFSYSFEPGRFIVAESGMLLVSVVDDKKTSKRRFIGVNSGFNHLIRPAMYGSYHEIENLSRNKGKKELITIAGNVCESGDLFAIERRMGVPNIRDVLAFRDTGAYGMSMASRYNLRELPKEILIKGVRMSAISR